MTRIGRVTWGLVTHRGRFGALACHAFSAETVDFQSGDARLDEGGEVVQYFRSQASCLTHALDVLRSFDGDVHGARLSHRTTATLRRWFYRRNMIPSLSFLKRFLHA